MRKIVELNVLCHSASVEQREKAESCGIKIDDPDLWLRMAIDFEKVSAVKVDNDSDKQCIIHFDGQIVIADITYEEGVTLMRSV
jgi:hypothetical protein